MPDATPQVNPFTQPIFRAGQDPHDGIDNLPDPPPWRQAGTVGRSRRGQYYQARPEELQLVNASLYLRRPLLLTGNPGVGKTTLAYAIAHQLKLGEVLEWRIASRSVVKEGLYSYDAIGRLQESKSSAPNAPAPDLGNYVRLGPLGTAFAHPHRVTVKGKVRLRPRVLLIDELDKSDIDLPNDLLHLFEDGEFRIDELARLAAADYPVNGILCGDGQKKVLPKADVDPSEFGRVRCQVFPIVIMTSNGEREFPAAFRRRCLELHIDNPNKQMLVDIVEGSIQRLRPTLSREEQMRLDLIVAGQANPGGR